MSPISLKITPPPILYDLLFMENVEDLVPDCEPLASQLIGVTSFAHPPFQGIDWLSLPEGMRVKTREAKAFLEEGLLRRGCTRDTCLIGVGGGALLDLVGFVAATYCRGIAYVSVPTTLLAMTDAAIGGKTGIDLPEAKNFIGAFYHPKRVYLYLPFLNSLPQAEFKSGLAETVKHALIGSGTLFSYLEEHLESILEGEVKEMILLSCQVKKELVERDPFETKGIRSLLNFGHTMGHAVEALSNYHLRHGEAVAKGMYVEALLAHEMGLLEKESLERIEHLLRRVPYDLSLPFSAQDILDKVALDKKNAKMQSFFVALHTIGEATLVPLPLEKCKEVLKRCSAPSSALTAST